MLIKLVGLSVLLLFVFVMTPAYANVTSLSLEKSFYTEDEDFAFIGDQEGKEQVFVIIRDEDGDYIGMLSDVNPGNGEYSVIPRQVSLFFKDDGTYKAIAFTNDQTENNGITIELEFNDEKLFEVPDFVLELETIGSKSVEVEKTVTFTASLIASSITDVTYSLKNAPSGATIDAKTGKFVWTPSKSHGNIQDVSYNFDIIANNGVQEDKENVTIIVKQAYQEPKPTEPKPTEPKPTEPKPTELGIASFVDKTKDPQSYVDRYNNEATYKKWFDDNFSEYDSIYQAVGLDEPLQIPAPFVDKTKDPQSYVDRYNNEATYKKWFDDNFSEYDSIYQAVGLDEPKVDDVEEPKVVEKKFGICGPGTKLIEGVCTIVEKPVVKPAMKPWWQFW